MVDKVIALFADTLAIDPARVQELSSPDTMREWDSLATMKLIVAFEDAFSVKLSTREILSMRTIEAIRSVLRKKGVENV
jgi:acyl carrier protein